MGTSLQQPYNRPQVCSLNSPERSVVHKAKLPRDPHHYLCPLQVIRAKATAHIPMKESKSVAPAALALAQLVLHSAACRTDVAP